MPMALTLGNVTGASKKTRPEMAMGSLLRAPTMEYVVELVTRTHQALVYEMKMELRPERIMLMISQLRVLSGKLVWRLVEDQSSRKREQRRRIGMERRLL